MEKVKIKQRIIEGVVISVKMNKTIIVKVEMFITHPFYKKRIKKFNKFKVHDSEEKAKLGDKVKIIEARPYSKEKHFSLFEIIK
ncbi:MAG: 30S ribosomal protein S17 [Candidatus Omnitrophica bacterium]|nr:30S ribosomal protein S17 [Candidatus Omnitrophota bacterium]